MKRAAIVSWGIGATLLLTGAALASLPLLLIAVAVSLSAGVLIAVAFPRTPYH